MCALFWLRGCWCCPIMSSIISPVNTAKSSCPWEKLWKGECQYWQTNKFWQRGDFWAIGQGYRHGPVGMSCKVNARWNRVCFLLFFYTHDMLWCFYNTKTYFKSHNFKISHNLPDLIYTYKTLDKFQSVVTWRRITFLVCISIHSRRHIYCTECVYKEKTLAISASNGILYLECKCTL